MNFLKDIYKFFTYLSFIDITFFVAIIVLLILIVTLIYFIRINRDILDEDDFFPTGNSNDNDKLDSKEEKKEDSLVQIVDKIEPDVKIDDYNDEEGELLDLESLTKKLKSEEDNEQLKISKYEQDQEEKAIISYDELLQKHNNYAINYEKEEVHDDLIVKKVDLNDLINKDKVEEIKEVRVISYQKEEAFLNALKELNRLLN